ncbi:type IV pilin [Methanoregula sp.]|uniref:type IV pilin N-terminal domain-containing protein n=1 Tax=Methanoregula sp. TaxID=2052170 RepID=UPI002375BEC6|nr:type IV pilin [Methanoregula sp.]MDD1685806.1 type IV pilin [Methanoregula sp.]
MMCSYEKSRDAGVSPVVGVMLMLVVTIIIAAVVSAFAGGLGGSQQKTPQASLQIKTGWVVGDDGTISTSNYDISFEHMGGDAIMTKDTQLITYLTLPNGTVVRHVQSPTSSYNCMNLYGSVSCTRAPHVYDNQKYGFPCGNAVTGFQSSAWFGNATWMSGDIARTYQMAYTAELLGLVPDASMYPTPDNIAITAGIDVLKECISNHSQIEVKLLHVPSGKYIIDKKVNLQ